MAYPTEPKLNELATRIIEYGRLAHEYGATDVSDVLLEVERAMKASLQKCKICLSTRRLLRKSRMI